MAWRVVDSSGRVIASGTLNEAEPSDAAQAYEAAARLAHQIELGLLDYLAAPAPAGRLGADPRAAG